MRVVAADPRIALADDQLVLARAPPVAEMLGLGPDREHEIRWGIDEATEHDRGFTWRDLDHQRPVAHDPSPRA